MCFLSPHSSSIQMVSGVTLTPSFSKCFKGKASFLIFEKKRVPCSSTDWPVNLVAIYLEVFTTLKQSQKIFLVRCDKNNNLLIETTVLLDSLFSLFFYLLLYCPMTNVWDLAEGTGSII